MSPPDVGEYPLTDNVWYLISRVNSELWHRATQRSIAELGITSTQGSILFMVASGKCRLAAELAREYGINASAVTRTIDRLEMRALLTRLPSTKDRRVVQLALTPQGHIIAARMPAIFTDVRDSLLFGLAPEEVAHLRSMLRRALSNTGDLDTRGRVAKENLHEKK